ncbi:MAG: rhamnulokinase [Phycisphaerae bacterium]|nr:rhamnulokinase [Phycisphaerae bacterium]
MASKAYLGIDLGAESGRAIVGLLEDDHLSLHEVHRFPNAQYRKPTGLHWDLDALWDHILNGIRRGIDWSRENGVRLTSVGVDTWGVDFGYLDDNGALLGPPHSHRDERNGPAYEKLIADLGREYLYEKTGIQFTPINSLPQVVAQREADRSVLDRADKLLFIPDLFHYMLTGRKVVEQTIASTSQMIDVHHGGWATEILDRLDIPTRMLAEIVPAGTRLGPLHPHIADQVGADDNLQVICPATHDTASAVVAVPADASTTWAYISSGTWSLMGAELDKPCVSDAAREASLSNEGGVDGTIRFLKNIIGLWLVQECRRHWEKQGEIYDYDQLTRAAAEAEPFRTLLDTFHPPLLNPDNMPTKIAEFARATGQPEPVEVGAVIRCCLESLALTYRHTLDLLEHVLGCRFDVLHILGGGGKNRLLDQMTADAIGRPVVVGPEEATAAGNLLIQAKGAGDLRDLAHIRRVIKASFQPETFTPRATDAWDEAYRRFAGLLGASQSAPTTSDS